MVIELKIKGMQMQELLNVVLVTKQLSVIFKKQQRNLESNSSHS